MPWACPSIPCTSPQRAGEAAETSADDQPEERRPTQGHGKRRTQGAALPEPSAILQFVGKFQSFLNFPHIC